MMLLLLLIFIIIPLIIILWISYLTGKQVHRSLLKKESPYAGLIAVAISVVLFGLLTISGWYIFTHSVELRR
ncbi:hypothetical protein [Ferruginibacter sp. HRS2-29]|uniref:hypothetical protein n=1 Tax=Ferruginibacter sp. HRS2-29 TaxID=2487334 RepID=UPI0020CCFF2F|nr:hypothetical protein [Ferruginibacter sp. HRS2-29]MCP9749676.1 hypothetical protein [Ferruginibacter sp. HRS2-29]